MPKLFGSMTLLPGTVDVEGAIDSSGRDKKTVEHTGIGAGAGIFGGGKGAGIGSIHLNGIVVVPITRTIRGLTTEVFLTPDDGLPVVCALNFDHLSLVQGQVIIS